MRHLGDSEKVILQNLGVSILRKQMALVNWLLK